MMLCQCSRRWRAYLRASRLRVPRGRGGQAARKHMTVHGHGQWRAAGHDSRLTDRDTGDTALKSQTFKDKVQKQARHITYTGMHVTGHQCQSR
jgi:hypothetical protein